MEVKVQFLIRLSQHTRTNFFITDRKLDLPYDLLSLLVSCGAIFAHQGFCVYEALAHLGMIMCILTARRPVYNETSHCCND